MALEETSKFWAYDISKKVMTKGELTDEQAISQSIEMILATSFGERLFNPYFGSTLPLQLFENFHKKDAETLVNQILDAIELWEDRVVVDRKNTRMKFYSGDNVLDISIPYYIPRKQVTSVFNKKIAI